VKRAAAILLTGSRESDACPPGVDKGRFARAVAEDTLDAVHDLADVQTVIAHADAAREEAQAIRWPGTELLEFGGEPAPIDVFAALAEAGYGVALAVAADAPDLPGLLLAKPFSALAGAPTETVSVIPADGGGLVAMASLLPPPAWLVDLAPDLTMSFAALQVAAPRRNCVRAAPVWHRLRAPADIARLDPELSGWEATRALLAGRPSSER
jgi:hypothetical protein